MTNVSTSCWVGASDLQGQHSESHLVKSEGWTSSNPYKKKCVTPLGSLRRCLWRNKSRSGLKPILDPVTSSPWDASSQPSFSFPSSFSQWIFTTSLPLSWDLATMHLVQEATETHYLISISDGGKLNSGQDRNRAKKPCEKSNEVIAMVAFLCTLFWISKAVPLNK